MLKSAWRGAAAGCDNSAPAAEGPDGEDILPYSDASTAESPGGRRPGGNLAMPGTRLALVADDQLLASSIQVSARKVTGAPAYQCRYDAARALLGRDTDGILLLAAANPQDAMSVMRLLQEICIQKLPPQMIVITGEGAANAAEWTRIEPYLTRRLLWPENAAELPIHIRQRLDRTQ